MIRWLWSAAQWLFWFWAYIGCGVVLLFLPRQDEPDPPRLVSWWLDVTDRVDHRLDHVGI